MGLLLVKPYLGCNLNCAYCYEREYRKRKKPSLTKPKLEYNLEKVFRRMEEFKNYHQVLDGDEILLTVAGLIAPHLGALKIGELDDILLFLRCTGDFFGVVLLAISASGADDTLSARSAELS